MPATFTPTLTPTPTEAPIPTQPANCTNLAKLVSETVDDGTVFPPNTKFIKTWTLRNDGTCNWLPDYAVVFIDGEQMDAVSPQKLGKAVAPGETIEVKVELVSPAKEGSYKGNWKLSTDEGDRFGLGKNASLNFWVEIKVDPKASAVELNLDKSPDWRDPMDNNDYAWYLGSDNVTDYAIKDGVMTIKTLRLTGEQWRIAGPPELDNFYLEGTFISGEECSGKDGYGLIVRAPNANAPYYDSGYIFVVACDGTYRIYKMVEGNYAQIRDWAGSAAILKGTNQTNKIGVMAVGNKLSLYINRKLAAEFNDDSFKTGKFGVLIRSADHENFTITLDELAYWNQ